MNQPANIDQSTGSYLAGVSFGDPERAVSISQHLSVLCDPASANWQKVKTNASRTVYRGQIDGQDVFCKHYHGLKLLKRLGRSLGRGDSTKELQLSKYLRSCGVDTPRPIASTCKAGLEWYACEAVAPSIPGDQWHAEQLSDSLSGRAAVRLVTVELAELIGKMHKAGAIHNDLHCGNVLVKTDCRTNKLVLIDLHRASRKRRLGRRTMAANLAQLLHDRIDFTSRTDRLRFLKHYLKVVGASGSIRGWAWMIEGFAARHRQRQYRQRDRRIFRANRYFSPISLGGNWRGHVILASKRKFAGSQAAELTFRPDEWTKALADPSQLLEGSDIEVFKESGAVLVVRRRINVGLHSIDVVIKRQRRNQFFKALVDCFRPARSIRSFLLGHKLLTRRIETALPLVAIQRRVGPWLSDSILITEAVQAPRLNEFLNTYLAQTPGSDRQLTGPQRLELSRDVLNQLGLMLRRLHDNRFAHRDLKANNILVRWSLGHLPQFVLLDLDGLRESLFITTRDKLQGLMRLNVSLLNCPAINHASRLRMLLGYLRRPGLGRIDYKQHWRILEVWSAKKLRQQIQSRRNKQKNLRRPVR